MKGGRDAANSEAKTSGVIHFAGKDLVVCWKTRERIMDEKVTTGLCVFRGVFEENLSDETRSDGFDLHSFLILFASFFLDDVLILILAGDDITKV